MRTEKTAIFKDSSRGAFVIMIPVYYENETRPAWRKIYTGTRKECEKEIENMPEALTATEEENTRARNYKMLEIEFLNSIGKHAAADAIRKQYNL